MSATENSPVIKIDTSVSPTIMWSGNPPAGESDLTLVVVFLPTSGNISLQVYFWLDGVTMFTDGYYPPDGTEAGYIWMNLPISNYDQFMNFMTSGSSEIYAIYEAIVTQQTHVTNYNLTDGSSMLGRLRRRSGSAVGNSR